MKILIADDDRVTRRMLEVILREWGYEPVVVSDGGAAWNVLQAADPPRMAIVDWLMPGMDGLELCRMVRADTSRRAPYLILLTVKDGRKDKVAGLLGGADDYIIKPFDLDELQARLRAGLRIVELQQNLADQLRETQENALARVKQVQGLLPICLYCKKIRDDQNYWQQVESYIAAHSNAFFSHSICPGCWASEVEPELQKMQEALGASAGLPEEPQERQG